MKGFIPKLKNIYLALVILSSFIGVALNGASFSLFGLIGVFTFVIFALFFLAITGRWMFSFVITSLIFIAVDIVNRIKVYFFKSRLFFTDFNLILDGSNFDTINQYWQIYTILVTSVILIVVTMYVAHKNKTVSYFVRMTALIFALIGGLGVYLLTLNKDNITTWQLSLPKGRGVTINIWMTLNGMQYIAPSYVGNGQLFVQQAQSLNLERKPSSHPDIVAFLQESTVDSKYFELGKELPLLSMFNSDDKLVSAISPMRVQTTGGGTWLSEFSFATGLNTDDFGAGKYSVFYSAALHLQTSFYQELKNNGYYTVLLTPMNKGVYNTREAYESFGIDLILQPQDFGYDAPENINLWNISSQEMVDYILEILNQYTDKPIAIFVLSINEHSPYSATHEDDFGIVELIEDKAEAKRMSDYLSRQVLLNEATNYLTKKLTDRNKPFIFLYFGDHHPALGGKLLRKDLFNEPEFVTQFVMKDNLALNKVENIGEITDINFLGGMILERINAEVSPYYDANIKMRYLCDGKLEDCEDQELVNSYKYYIYNTLKAASAHIDE